MKTTKTIIAALFFLGIANGSVLLTGCKHTDSEEETHVHKYTCAHHPEVVQTTPGNCPKCGMKLEHKD